jgi:hypothetical protein
MLKDHQSAKQSFPVNSADKMDIISFYLGNGIVKREHSLITWLCSDFNKTILGSDFNKISLSSQASPTPFP